MIKAFVITVPAEGGGSPSSRTEAGPSASPPLAVRFSAKQAEVARQAVLVAGLLVLATAGLDNAEIFFGGTEADTHRIVVQQSLYDLDGGVAAGPPGGGQGGELVGAVFPGEVARVDDVELAVGQPLVEELGVGGRDRPVVAAGDVEHR